MSEDKKDQSSSQQGSSQAEDAGKKVQQAASATAGAPAEQKPPAAGQPAQSQQSNAPGTTGPAPAPLPPRPAAAPLPPRPAAAKPPGILPPVPPSRPKPAKDGRRNFLIGIITAAVVLTMAPFVPWGQYLSSTLESSGAAKKQQVVIDANPQYGGASGAVVNVNDLKTFPPNSHWVFTYPSAGNTSAPTSTDATQNFQNPDTFVKFELIRLPVEMGGDSKSAADFVAFSKVCVHLWCSPNYNPEQCTNASENGYPAAGACTPHEQYECPCHGSIYRIPDGLAKAGPASDQPAPTNAIPMLTLTADSNGTLYVEPPVWDIEHNGVIGYGRDYLSYANYIKPAAESASSSSNTASTG